MWETVDKTKTPVKDRGFLRKVYLKRRCLGVRAEISDGYVRQ